MTEIIDACDATLAIPLPVREETLEPSADLIHELEGFREPVLLRGLVASWPIVSAARDGDAAMLDYLRRFDRGAAVQISVGAPELDGRVYYDAGMRKTNVDRGPAQMSDVLDRLGTYAETPDAPLVYLASTAVEECVPGFRQENDLPFGERDPLASIWLGTRTRIAAHNDLPLNVACVAAGRRRFTLFPPDQTPNLYVGPLDFTPAGRPISLVNFTRPDLGRFPRFADAMAKAQVAEMEPGDALFIPSMWWHHVEALSAVNVLINYWWRTVPRYFGTPQDVLNHALLTIRDLPEGEKKIWRDQFDHYVFGDPEVARAHIPEHAQGVLAPMTEPAARRLRAFLLNQLNR